MAGLSPTSSKFAVEGRLQVTSLLDIGVVSPWVVLGCSGSTNSLVNGGQSSSIAHLPLCTNMHLILQPDTDVVHLFSLEIVIWKVPSLVGNAVTISFVGLFVSLLL